MKVVISHNNVLSCESTKSANKHNKPYIRNTLSSNVELKISIDAGTNVQLRADAKPASAFGSETASSFPVAMIRTNSSVNVT